MHLSLSMPISLCILPSQFPWLHQVPLTTQTLQGTLLSLCLVVSLQSMMSFLQGNTSLEALTTWRPPAQRSRTSVWCCYVSGVTHDSVCQEFPLSARFCTWPQVYVPKCIIHDLYCCFSYSPDSAPSSHWCVTRLWPGVAWCQFYPSAYAGLYAQKVIYQVLPVH